MLCLAKSPEGDFRQFFYPPERTRKGLLFQVLNNLPGSGKYYLRI